MFFWPKPWMSCWDDKFEAANHPIAVLEWKLKAKARKLRCDRHDEKWLAAFSASQLDFVGYAVTVSRTRPASIEKMCVSRLYRGIVDHNWLTL